MIETDEGDEDEATANSLYRRLLPINYYETIEIELDGDNQPVKDSQPLEEVPRSFTSVQVSLEWSYVELD